MTGLNRAVFKSCNASCELSTPSLKLIEEITTPENRNTLEKMIPSLEISEIGQTSVSSRLFVCESPRFSLLENYPKFSMSQRELNYLDVVALIEFMLERGGQEEGVYNLHSSSVGRDKKCVVIHGASKSGKTLISLAASQACDLKFLTNERTLLDLDSAQMMGGCRTLDLTDYHRQVFNQLRDFETIYLGKEELSYKIRAIVQPAIDSGSDALIVKHISPIDAEWAIYPEITSRIRGVEKRLRVPGQINRFSYALESLDSKELARKRMCSLNRFLSRVPVYFVRGRLEAISSFVESKIDGA